VSDYIERHCARCGSPLHHEDDCRDFGLDVPKQTPRCGTCVHHDGERCRKLGPRSAEAAIPRRCWETALYMVRRKDSPR